MSAAILDNLINRSIGGYRIISRVARGGCGTVWKAQSQKKTVAVKVLNQDVLNDKKVRIAFEREFNLCQAFKHKGLLRYLKYGEFKKIPFMVMEYFPALSKEEMLSPNGMGVRRDLVHDLIMTAAEAMAYYHDKGVIHRDLKPDNILVDAKGQAKIIDFSAAIAGLQRFNPFGRTAPGTPSYIAPEQLMKKRPTHLSDIYSFGATIFEYLTGRPPFVCDKPDDLLHSHVKAAAPIVSKFNPHVTPEIDKLIKAMLAKDPQDRPRDMRTFLVRFSKLSVYME